MNPLPSNAFGTPEPPPPQHPQELAYYCPLSHLAVDVHAGARYCPPPPPLMCPYSPQCAPPWCGPALSALNARVPLFANEYTVPPPPSPHSHPYTHHPQQLAYYRPLSHLAVEVQPHSAHGSPPY